MSLFSSQRGQATVEWVGLLLGVALALGALVAGGREAASGESADGLGEAVAERIACAARDLCGARAGTEPHLPRGPAGVPPPARGGDSAGLRSVPGVVKRTWLLCLGHRRWRYEAEHPMSPRQSVPAGESLRWVNECVNPLSFLFE